MSVSISDFNKDGWPDIYVTNDFSWGNLSANNFRILRLGHIILWAAEAKVELGKLEEARALVNRLRARAANPDGFVPEAIQGAKRPEYTTISNPAANNNIKEYTDP